MPSNKPQSEQRGSLMTYGGVSITPLQTSLAGKGKASDGDLKEFALRLERSGIQWKKRKPSLTCER